MEAAAAYFQARRKRLGWSRAKLATELGVSEMSVYRIEEKGQRPEPELLARLVRALKARWEDVERLLLDEVAFDQAESLADAPPETKPPPDDIEERIMRLSPQQRQVFRQLLGLLPDQGSA